MRYLLVKNWRDHQHYKKRSPPWIKLHRAITEDYEFAALKDRCKAHLIMIWILAAGTEGRIPNDAKFLSSRINANEPVDLEAMIAAGFLIPEDGEQPSTPSHKGNGATPPNMDTGDVLERIPMIGGEEFEVRKSFADELARLYPAVDVPATLKQMRGWCLGNQQKLKTPRGIRKFITGWCERDQNGSAR